MEFPDGAAPKKKYCELCQSLPTYGVTFFLVKEKVEGKNKLTPRLLGVNKDSVLRVDEKTKHVIKEYPLEQVRSFVPGAKTFTLVSAAGFFLLLLTAWGNQELLKYA